MTRRHQVNTLRDLENDDKLIDGYNFTKKPIEYPKNDPRPNFSPAKTVQQ